MVLRGLIFQEDTSLTRTEIHQICQPTTCMRIQGSGGFPAEISRLSSNTTRCRPGVDPRCRCGVSEGLLKGAVRPSPTQSPRSVKGRRWKRGRESEGTSSLTARSPPTPPTAEKSLHFGHLAVRATGHWRHVQQMFFELGSSIL